MYIQIRKITDESNDNNLIVTVTKNTPISEIRKTIEEKWHYKAETQKLYYKGKQLTDQYRIMDYSIQLNDVVQLLVKDDSSGNSSNEPEAIDCESIYFRVKDRVQARVKYYGAWFNGTVTAIKRKNILDSVGLEDESDRLFSVLLHDQTEPDSTVQVPLIDIRPMPTYMYQFSELAVGDIVLVNYNIEKPDRRGYWYDLKITNLSEDPKSICGTILIDDGKSCKENCHIKFVEQVMKIEKVEKFTDDSDSDVSVCTYCNDMPDRRCIQCGCFVCKFKIDPHKIVLCDDCNSGYHIWCLNPPLLEVPKSTQWYCPTCKTDEDEIVKDGDELKSSKRNLNMPSCSRNSENKREWGRGMACVGKTTECTIVPKNHFGPIPGIDVGFRWKYRIQVSESGVHRPHIHGIHGRENEGAYSIILSGGYEDDVDNGEDFIYTGSGGRNLKGRRQAGQTSDQVLTRMNKALALSCNVEFSEDGAESKDWKLGKPVRVVRNYKLKKHSIYAPAEGNRYDGIYKVVKYYREKGKSGFNVWKYSLIRDDCTPPPWSENAAEFPLIFPPGYTAAKKSKNPKRLLGESDTETEKKTKLEPFVLDRSINTCIKRDRVNATFWNECATSLANGKQAYLLAIQEAFKCCCCHELLANPVTLKCKHNVCRKCLIRSFESEIFSCPNCRTKLGPKFRMEINKNLSKALCSLFPGYENGRI